MLGGRLLRRLWLCWSCLLGVRGWSSLRLGAGFWRLVLIALAAALGLSVLLPRVESWWGIEVPLPWYIGGLAIAVVVIVALIIRALSRLAIGLDPDSS